MKKLTYILLLFSFSCTNLEEVPPSNLTTEQFYKNEKDALAAVNAIYHRMFTEQLVLFNRQLMMLEMATDDVTAGPRTRSAQVVDMSKLQHVPNNTAVEWTWQYTYEAINRANIAVDRIEALGEDVINSELKTRLVNEAKLLRAWNYFNLVRWFGPVPLILHETTSLTNEALQVQQASEEVLYNQIILDLTSAESLPAPGTYATADAGRVTAGAAKTLLAKVYLTRKEWGKAADKLKEVIDLGWYSLFDNFADVYNVATKNGKEHIFSIQFNGDPSIVNHLAMFSLPFEFNGEYVDAPHLPGQLYESYDLQDERRNLTLAKQLYNPQTGQTVNLQHLTYVKFFDSSKALAPQQSAKNIPLFRYADILLMYAEALNELNGPTQEAYHPINLVRQRAHIPLLQEVSLNLTKEQFRDAVFLERRKELALEYHRWFDLARRGPEEYVKALHAAGKTNAAPRHVHFPVPQRELQLNLNLRQHPDWVGF
ncbi:RagB/SusD family nutrient uptake outer membrane protein [Pontibacter qinzhouensis]|uniref:RagB/SusD family nutrient uptake outer membrane protein n=1 Tax=Pontibacter qinzhouensis TaxID=2603253 RepID=A0A5C8KB48_9BACT|nr:RagB/SusD family nutrient uptake outer membrane protein [Pontibacter qinzhouensis]TXK49356.1 RagB/SusD family nutrient uptake outer membrane protein [Pontibacter qinzhouensis]